MATTLVFMTQIMKAGAKIYENKKDIILKNSNILIQLDLIEENELN